MFARITPFKMKAGSRDEARKIMDRLKDQIMGLKGMKHFVCAMNEDGSGYVVALVESKAASDANQPKVRELWANFSTLLERQPEPQGFDVIEEWAPQPA